MLMDNVSTAAVKTGKSENISRYLIKILHTATRLIFGACHDEYGAINNS